MVIGEGRGNEGDGFFFFQAEDGIRDAQESRGLGDVYKRQAHHYDISDDLYDLFLDPKRQYSCAYFKSENESLETAQNNKIDHLIKKLNLKPNQKVLDIGSGWGSLAIEIAKKTKCEVTGITLSENQYKYSLNKVKENNLENQVQFKLADYRNLREKFDRIVSVGMFEHVGRKFYKTFFRQVNNLLNYDGLALIHTIGSINTDSSGLNFIKLNPP